MAPKLNTDIHGLYKLPYYEYRFYVQLENERIKAANEKKNIMHQEKFEIQRGGKMKSIKSPESVNLPDRLK
jgi:hypothetical protein